MHVFATLVLLLAPDSTRLAPIGAGAEANPLAAVSTAAAAAGDSGRDPQCPDGQTLSHLATAGLDRARVWARGRPYRLRHPEFGIDGIRYRRAEGFPMRRPALFTGSDWDSVPPPPRPIPWSMVERIDRPRPNLGLGGVAGALTGASLGYLYTGLVLMEADAAPAGGLTAVISGAVVGGLAGGWRGHRLFDPTNEWDALYLPTRR